MSIRPDGRPPFRADHVGSLLRPPALRQAFRSRAAGTIDDDAFAQVQDRAIRDAVRMQEEIGLPVVTDGEFRRGSYWGRFVERTEGLEVRPALIRFRDDHGHEVDFTAPYATAVLRRTRALALDEFVFLRAVASVTPKITLPAPSTMHFLRFTDFAAPGVYGDVERYFADLVAVFAQEIADLVAAGCRYLQLDEIAVALLCDPSIRARVAGSGGDPDELVDRYIDAINGAVAACPADVVVGVHMCRGNFKGNYLADGGYESVAERFFARTRANHFLLEYDTAARRRFRAAAVRSRRQGRGARPDQQQAPRAREPRCPAPAPRRGRAVHGARAAGDQPAVRLRQQRRRQSARRGRRARQAAPGGRCRARDLGVSVLVAGAWTESAVTGFREDAVALQVDDLLGLGDGKGDRVVPARIGVGPDEAMLLHAFGSDLLDDAGGLILPVRLKGRRPDAVSLVFDRRRRRRVALAAGT